MLKSILDPDLYHGKGKKDNFFEGWYFKLVHPQQKYVMCFIPGIKLSGDSHSFIQVLEGHNTNFSYISFKSEEFKFNPNRFEIKISNNYFSITDLVIDLVCGNKRIKGALKLHNTKKWPDSMLNPGSMGFYNYLTFMQCYSQVCSMNSLISGHITIDNEFIDFTGGKAYIEKNWGREFPNSYIWTQCNTFNLEDISLSCSIANIPFPIFSFTGFLIGLHINSAFYKFTTVNTSKIKLSSKSNEITVVTYNKKYILQFTASAPADSFMNLYAPKSSNMIPIARESLQAELQLQLTDAVTKKLLFNVHGRSGGLEFGGNYGNLSTQL
jgi:tocopherol cyclase